MAFATFVNEVRPEVQPLKVLEIEQCVGERRQPEHAEVEKACARFGLRGDALKGDPYAVARLGHCRFNTPRSLGRLWRRRALYPLNEDAK